MRVWIITIVITLAALATFGAEKESAPEKFNDLNFKLVVISSLMDQGDLNFGSLTEFLADVEGEEYDYEVDGYELSEKAIDFFQNLHLTKSQLEKVETLTFDGGNTVYPYLYPFWGGETEDFDVYTIKDVDKLPNLTTFVIASTVLDLDLTPLSSLTKLQEVSLSFTNGEWEHLDVLLELPELERAEVFEENISSKKNAEVIQTLKSRGVEVLNIRASYYE